MHATPAAAAPLLHLLLAGVDGLWMGGRGLLGGCTQRWSWVRSVAERLELGGGAGWGWVGCRGWRERLIESADHGGWVHEGGAEPLTVGAMHPCSARCACCSARPAAAPATTLLLCVAFPSCLAFHHCFLAAACRAALQLEHPQRVQATIALVRYDSLGAVRIGVCSTFVGERLEEGQQVPVYIHKNPDFRWAGAVGGLGLVAADACGGARAGRSWAGFGC